MDLFAFTPHHATAVLMALHKRLGQDSALGLLSIDDMHKILCIVRQTPENMLFLLFWGDMLGEEISSKGSGATSIGAVRGGSAKSKGFRGGGSAQQQSIDLDQWLTKNASSFAIRNAQNGTIVPLQAVPQKDCKHTAAYLTCLRKLKKMSNHHPHVDHPETKMLSPAAPLLPGDHMFVAQTDLTRAVNNTRTDYHLLTSREMDSLRKNMKINYERKLGIWQLKNRDEVDPHGVWQGCMDDGLDFEYPDEMLCFRLGESNQMTITEEGGMQESAVTEGSSTMRTQYCASLSEYDLVPTGRVWIIPIKVWKS